MSDARATLERLLGEVRSKGSEVPDAELLDSDLILPAADATVDDVRDLLHPSGEGLIPG